LLLSFQGGAIGFEIIRTRAIGSEAYTKAIGGVAARTERRQVRALTRADEFSTIPSMPSNSPPAPPPEPEADHDPLEPPSDAEEGEESRADAEGRPGLERILPELIRKGFEAGRVPLERVSESIFPKDIASHLVSQLGDIRSGVVKAVAQEVGRFLREADIASEVRKVLTGLDMEATVKLRFSARDGGTIKPEVQLKVDGETDDKPRANERRKR
jgi:hypothetical protein